MEERSLDILKHIIENTSQRLNDILYYYKNKNLQKTDEYYTQHSIIILLTLLEIELIKEKLDIQQKKIIKIYQYNFENKRPCYYPIDNNKCDKKIVSDFKIKLAQIEKELKDFIDIGEICYNYNISVIDDLFYPNKEKDHIMIIIENAYNSNFHKFFIEYINEFIIFRAKNNNIYSKEILIKFKFIKYITQILIFIKLYIKSNLIKEKFIAAEFKDVLLEDKILTYFSLSLLRNTHNKVKSYLIKDNEKALNELTNFYSIILKIIEKIEKQLNNTNL